MKMTIVATYAMMAIAGFVVPVKAQETTPTDRAEATKEQILNACVENRAETLPQLYTDVPPTEWAYKAVQTMAYCGAFRQATPPSMVERLLRSDENLLPNPRSDEPQPSSR